MPSLYQFSEIEMLAFIMVLIRVSAFFISWPIFGTGSVPSVIKILIALVVSIVLLPVVPWQGLEADLVSLNIVFLALKEAMVGAVIGFLCRLFFFAVSVAGQIISLSMGLSNAQIMNPTLGTQGNVIEQFEVTLATLFFLAINGHHVLLRALTESFTTLPLSMQSFQLKVFSQFGTVVQDVVVAGIQIGAPVMIALLCMNVTMGIVGRAVPQINVLITSLPVNILVGLLILMVSVPMFVDSMGVIANSMFEHLFSMMKEI